MGCVWVFGRGDGWGSYLLYANQRGLFSKSVGNVSLKDFRIYNHATSNLAIFSHETSQDKLPEA